MSSDREVGLLEFELYKRGAMIIVQHKFAWRPVWIRAERNWAWLVRYTRIWKWNSRLGRYRTVWTEKGWRNAESYS